MGAWNDLLDGLDSRYQRPAVVEPGTAVVSAGAGSGKTRVLAVRYLHLVKERGIGPERILCLTFTKKAAAEMNERIRGMLAACAADDADFAAALDAFPKGRVSTLDSFCGEVARNSCARWGVVPDFAVDEEDAARAIEAFAVRFLLERRDEPTTASFLAANGFEASVEALKAYSGSRRGLIAARPRSGAMEQDRALAEAARSLDERLRELMGGGLGLDAGAAKGAVRWAELAATLDAAPLPEPGDAGSLRAAEAAYRAIADERIATGKSPGAAYYNEAGKAAKPVAAAAILACEALLDGDRAASIALLDEFARLAADERAASGRLAYADVASMALAALSDDLVLRDWYKSRWDAVMIDEFQDDNELQKELLYRIAERRDRRDPTRGPDVGPEDLEPGVLFFVGDEKQSIYKFRGADVSVFRGLAGELAKAPGGLSELKLSVNWRSEPGLIGFFNETFSRAMPGPDEAGVQDYEARFEPLEAGPRTPGVDSLVAHLEYGAERDDGLLSPAEAEAWAIADLIETLIRERTPVARKSGAGKIASPCAYEDVAVLFRSTGEQNLVERFLRLKGIPYTAASAFGLFAESICGDIYSALRAAAYPDDRLAYASFLRGPLAGLSDDSVFAALSAGGRPGDAADATDSRIGGLWDFDGTGLPSGDAERYAAATQTWRRLRGDADREPLARLVEYLWYERGLRWNVLRRDESASYLEHFDFIWAMASKADARGDRLVDFVASLEAVVGTSERIDEGAVREASRGVQVMTVHRSKGLEFPVVILPSVDSAGRDREFGPISETRRFGRSIRRLGPRTTPRDAVAELGRALDRMERGSGEEAMDENLAEAARLFYVACTRAISRLYLVGSIPRGSDKAGKSFRGLLLKAWPGIRQPSRSDVDFVPEDFSAARHAPALGEVAPRTRADYERLAAGDGKAGSIGVTGGADADAGRARAIAAAAGTAPSVRGRRWRMGVTEAAELVRTQTLDTSHYGAIGRPRAAVEGDGGISEADFGTLCHGFAGTLLLDPAADPRIGNELPRPLERLLESLGAAERKKAIEEAYALARGFIATSRGAEAARALAAKRSGEPGAVFELEYPFAWRSEGGEPVVLSGVIDLVYRGTESLVVVDFKTDREIDPDRHRFQLAVYREAAESIFGSEARAFVHYLRGGTEAEIRGAPDAEAVAAASFASGT